jgi:hypothetical protein
LVDTTVDLSSNPERLEIKVVRGTEDVQAGKKCPHCGAWMTAAQVYYYDTESGKPDSEEGKQQSFLGYLCPHHGAVNEAGESLLR